MFVTGGRKGMLTMHEDKGWGFLQALSTKQRVVRWRQTRLESGRDGGGATQRHKHACSLAHWFGFPLFPIASRRRGHH